MKLKIVLVTCLLLLIIAIGCGIYFGLTADMSYDEPEINLNSITESGSLAVLSAHVNITNSLVIGAPSDIEYMKLFGQEATAIFYVDLANAEISKGANLTTGKPIIFIKLLEPSVELYIDESSTKNIAEFQVNSNWTGSAEEGYRAYFEQSQASYEKMLESLQESDGLLLEAKDSAIKMVTKLVDALSLDDIQFEVYFSSKGIK